MMNIGRCGGSGNIPATHCNCLAGGCGLALYQPSGIVPLLGRLREAGSEVFPSLVEVWPQNSVALASHPR